MKGNDRLYPSIFRIRRLSLSRLRDKTVEMIKQPAAGNGRQMLVDFGRGNMLYRALTGLAAEYKINAQVRLYRDSVIYVIAA